MKILPTIFLAMISLLPFPFNSHKINRNLEPIVVGKVLQNFKVRYNTLQLLSKSITLAIPLPKLYCNTVMRATLMHSSKSLSASLGQVLTGFALFEHFLLLCWSEFDHVGLSGARMPRLPQPVVAV